MSSRNIGTCASALQYRSALLNCCVLRRGRNVFGLDYGVARERFFFECPNRDDMYTWFRAIEDAILFVSESHLLYNRYGIELRNASFEDGQLANCAEFRCCERAESAARRRRTSARKRPRTDNTTKLASAVSSYVRIRIHVRYISAFCSVLESLSQTTPTLCVCYTSL